MFDKQISQEQKTSQEQVNMNPKKSTFTEFVRALFAKRARAEKVILTPLAEDVTPWRGKKVLVVDDDPIFQKIISRKLNTEGYEVISAFDGAQALKAIREDKPDAVLLDINLPPDISGMSIGWDGFRLMHWIRCVEGRALPMFIITSDDISNYEAKAAADGAKGIFYKPLDPKKLVSMVENVLERQVVAA